jgi:hypothetical protein
MVSFFSCLTSTLPEACPLQVGDPGLWATTSISRSGCLGYRKMAEKSADQLIYMLHTLGARRMIHLPHHHARGRIGKRGAKVEIEEAIKLMNSL